MTILLVLLIFLAVMAVTYHARREQPVAAERPSMPEATVQDAGMPAPAPLANVDAAGGKRGFANPS